MPALSISSKFTNRPGRHAPLDRETALLRASGCIKVSGVRAKIRAMRAAEERHALRDPRFAVSLAMFDRGPRIERVRYYLDPIRQEVDDLRSCLALDRSGWLTIHAPAENADAFRRAA